MRGTDPRDRHRPRVVALALATGQSDLAFEVFEAGEEAHGGSEEVGEGNCLTTEDDTGSARV